MSTEFRFKIDAISPDRLPLDRLAAYLADLATMLGEPAALHLVQVERGSTIGVLKADGPTERRVINRVRELKVGTAPQDALQAYERVNAKLGEDRTSASLIRGKTAKILFFRGGRSRAEQVIGPVSQDGTLDGTVIRLGGKANPCPVSIIDADDKIMTCYARRTIAREMAPFLYGAQIRVFGTGRWYRYERSGWKLDTFRITQFQPLIDEPLEVTVNRLRMARGSNWPNSADPWGELNGLRNGHDEMR